MTFPTDFPQAFVNYCTQEDAASKSVTRYYANAVALQAARTGKPLPDGSIIMVEGKVADVTTYYSGMERHAGWGDGIPELLRNGDWATRSSTRRKSAARRTITPCASAVTRASRRTASSLR